jgi:phosphatidyl-myo-inositol dimannoside synthase
MRLKSRGRDHSYRRCAVDKKQTGLLIINGPLRPAMGGISTFLSHVVPYLAEQGMQVHTVMDRRPDNASAHEEYEKMGIHIHYCRTSLWAVVPRLVRYLPLWFRIFRETGGEFLVALKSYKSIVRWYDVCEDVIRKHDIEILHAFDYPWVQGWVATVLAQKYGKRFFQMTYGEVTPHVDELTLHDRKSERYKKFAQTVLNSAELITSCSRHCARELEYVGIDPATARVVYHGIDTNLFRPGLQTSEVRAQYGLEDKRMVLFVGQIRQRKGPQVLLEAVPSILKQFPDVLVCFAGPDHGMLATLQQRSRELKVESGVRFLGPVAEEVLPNLYNACDVFVFPSCTPIECLGLSTVQAMACGKPAVGSRINGVPEVIQENVTGFLVEPNDPAVLAEKVNILLGQDALRERMGSEGIRRARMIFEQRVLAEELHQLYTQPLH